MAHPLAFLAPQWDSVHQIITDSDSQNCSCQWLGIKATRRLISYSWYDGGMMLRWESRGRVQMSVKMSKCCMHERLWTHSHSALKQMLIWPELKGGLMELKCGWNGKMEAMWSILLLVSKLSVALEEITITTILLSFFFSFFSPNGTLTTTSSLEIKPFSWWSRAKSGWFLCLLIQVITHLLFMHSSSVKPYGLFSCSQASL